MAPDFVGREHELQLLDGLLNECASGRARVALVSGEPGIGKSRLLEELAGRAVERGYRVLWGRCWEAGGAATFWPWLEVLRAAAQSSGRERLDALVPQLCPHETERGPLARSDNELARFRVFEAATALLMSAPEPQLVVLDDLHAADQLSLLFLNFLARSRRSAPLLVVGSYRDAEARQRSDAATLLARTAREAECIPLGRLSASDAGLLARSQARRPIDERTLARVFETTEGNPLFIGEVMRCLSGERPTLQRTLLPEGIRQAIAEHLSQLSDAARELLRVAAVCGRDFSSRELRELARRTPDEVASGLREALLAGVVSEPLEGRDRARFTHILIQETLYRELAPSAAAELHAAAGELLLRLHGDESGEHLALLAHHFTKAASVIGAERALRHGIRAAEYAFSKLAFEDAAELYSWALDGLDADAPAELRSRLLSARGEAQMCFGRVVEARASCVSAARFAHAAGSAELIARAALIYASHFGHGARDELMVELLRGARLALPEGDSSLRARVTARLASALLPCEDIAESVALGREAIAMARRLGDSASLLYAMDAASTAVTVDLTPTERADYLREAVALSGVVGDHASLLHARASLAQALYASFDLNQAEAAVADFERLARDIPEPRVLAWRLVLASLRASARGRLGEVAELSTELEALAERCDYAPAQKIAQRTRLLLAFTCGDTAAMERGVRDLKPVLAFEFTLRGMLQASLGNHAAALADAAHWDTAPGTMWASSRGGPIVDLTILLGDRSRAAVVYEQLQRYGEEAWIWGLMAGFYLGSVARRLGELATLLERRTEAYAWFEKALKKDAQAPVQLALSQLSFARALSTESDRILRERARTLADAALAGLLELGLEALAERARELIGTLETPRPSTAPPGPTDATALRIEPVPPPAFSLGREGEYWSLHSHDGVLHLKESKGIVYLDQLLRHPGREFHVLELAAELDAGASNDLGDAGELLDPEAKRAYRAHIAALQEAADEATSLGDLERAGRAREELELIAEQLAQAVGLGGRDRRAASAAERARVNVQKRIRSAIQRILREDPRLGRYLESVVKTGTYCVFLPTQR